MLEDPKGWWRDTAHRLLFERQDRSAVGPLRDLLRQSKQPLARLHALWSLEGLGALEEKDLARALADGSAGLREHAVRLAEPRLGESPALLEQVLALAGDPAIRVRFQAAFTLGQVKAPRATEALAAIARRDASDPWSRTAVLSSAADRCDGILELLFKDPAFGATPPGRELIRQLAMVVGARRQPAEVSRVLSAMAEGPAGRADRNLQRSVAAGVGDGLKRAGLPLRKAIPDASSPAARLIDALLGEAERLVRDDRAATDQRREAVQLLGCEEFERVKSILPPLLEARQPQELQIAVIQTLASYPSPQVAGLLLAAWRSLTPAVRGEAVEALLARKERLHPLLDAIEARTVAVDQVPATRRTLLLRHADAKIQDRARQLFGQDAPSPRKEVLTRYRAALGLAGDRQRGELTYKRECATCHRLGEQGHEVGPNLNTIRHRSADELLVDLLDPNRQVSPNYQEYIVTLADGRATTGIITAETATSITLRRPENVQETILRRNIDEITSTARSLMPEGLEQKLTPQDVADLLAFLLRPK